MRNNPEQPSMEKPIVNQSTASPASTSCMGTQARFIVKGVDTATGGASKPCAEFAKACSTKTLIRSRRRTIVTLGLLFISGQLHGQRATQLSEGASRDAQTLDPHAALPKTAEEIDGAIARIEAHLNDVRLKISVPKTT